VIRLVTLSKKKSAKAKDTNYDTDVEHMRRANL
jgi:hypothetical protein